MPWTIESVDPHLLDELVVELGTARAASALARDLEILRERGLNLLDTNRMKNLGAGLYELRIRKSPDVLIRVFLTMVHPSRLILLSAYNKQRDSSELRQRREIKNARKLIDQFHGKV